MAKKDWTDIKQERPTDMKKLRRTAVVREAAVLTGSYVASDDVDISMVGSVGIMFEITQASLTSIEYIVDQSPDEGTGWCAEGAEDVALATITDGSPNYTTTDFDDYYKVVPAIGDRMRIRVKGTGTVAGSSLKITLKGIY
jgi:hypothetical protein